MHAHCRGGWVLPPIVLVLLVALGLRIGWFGLVAARAPDLGVLAMPDTPTYLEPARLLLASGSFCNAGGPEFIRTPGYPLFLLPGILLGHVELVTIGMQIVLGVWSVYLIYQTVLVVSRRPQVALACGWLYCFEPLSIVYCSYLLTETLFTFLIVLFWHQLARYFEENASGRLAWAGLALCGSAYVRPISYFLPALVAAVLIARGLCQWEARGRRLAHAAIFLVGCAAVLGAWQVRNHAVAGYLGFSAITDHNLYFYQQAAVLAQETGKPFSQVQGELGQQDREVMFTAHPQWRSLGPGDLYQRMGEEALGVVRAHTLQYAQIHLRGLITLWITPGSADYLQMLGCYPDAVQFQGRGVDLGPLGSIDRVLRGDAVVMLTSIGLGLVLAAYWGLGLVGLWGLWWKQAFRWTWCDATLLIVGAYFLALSGGPTAVARLRHPMMPAIVVLAGYGVIALVKHVRCDSRLSAAREAGGRCAMPRPIDSLRKSPCPMV